MILSTKVGVTEGVVYDNKLLFVVFIDITSLHFCIGVAVIFCQMADVLFIAVKTWPVDGDADKFTFTTVDELDNPFAVVVALVCHVAAVALIAVSTCPDDGAIAALTLLRILMILPLYYLLNLLMFCLLKFVQRSYYYCCSIWNS